MASFLNDLAQAAAAPKIRCSIEDFPEEILREVFRAVVAGVDGGAYITTLETLQAPWCLIQVNSLWRRVATSFPDLWTHYNLYLEDERSPSTDLMERALLYSQSQPITIAVSTDTKMFYHPVFQLLVRHSHQWRQARLVVPPTLLMWMSTAQNGYGMLERLDIRTTAVPDMPWRPMLPEEIFRILHLDLKDASRLTYVNLRGHADCGYRLDVNLPGERLTSFTGCVADFLPNISEGLGQASNLEELDLTIFQGIEPKEPFPRNAFRRMERLTLRPAIGIRAFALIEAWSLPALKELHLLTHLDDATLLSLESMLANCSCSTTLTSLSLISKGIYTFTSRIAGILKHTPNLQELLLESYGPSSETLLEYGIAIDNSALEVLNFTQNPHCVPCLTNLTLIGSFEGFCFLQMAWSRLANLRSATVCVESDLFQRLTGIKTFVPTPIPGINFSVYHADDARSRHMFGIDLATAVRGDWRRSLVSHFYNMGY